MVKPELQQRLTYLGPRLGGGSMAEVRRARFDLPREEALRVLAPNALFHARRTVGVLDETLDLAAGKDERFQKGKPLLKLVNRWIEAEFNDSTFEADDLNVFRREWHGWRPDTWSSGPRIYIPELIPTETPVVQRQEFVKALSFSNLASFSPRDRMEQVALGAQFYLAQLKGRGMNFGEVLVLSNISKGNAAKMEQGNLAVFDRGWYLRFNLGERLFLKGLLDEPSIEGRARKLCEMLERQPENSGFTWNAGRRDYFNRALSRIGDGAAIESSALTVFSAMNDIGLDIPPKWGLLFINFNAWGQMAREAGFQTGLSGALAFRPS